MPHISVKRSYRGGAEPGLQFLFLVFPKTIGETNSERLKKGNSRNENVHVCALYAEQDTCHSLLELHIFCHSSMEMTRPFNVMLFHPVTVLSGRAKCVIVSNTGLRINTAF